MNKSKGERETNTHIFFWGGIFSQWHRSSFVEKDIMYNCAEQYMMAHKALLFGDTEILNEIMKVKNPRDHKALGRKIRRFEPSIWNKAKFNIVVKGNYLKFTQDETLEALLLSTGNKTLVEASPYDKIWGIGLHPTDDKVLDESQWQGENLLGKAVMEVRESLIVKNLKDKL